MYTCTHTHIDTHACKRDLEGLYNLGGSGSFEAASQDESQPMLT